MLGQISYFGDYMKMMMVIIISMFMACNLAFIQSSKAKAEMLSREEMVEMAGYGEEKLSTVLVTGTLLCEACLDHALTEWPISGAVVAVKCQTASESKSGSAQSITDGYGDFVIDLPSHLHGIPNLHKICQVKVVHIPKKSMCRPAAAVVKKHMGLRLSSVDNGIRTYTAHDIRFQHINSKPLETCIRMPVIHT